MHIACDHYSSRVGAFENANGKRNLSAFGQHFLLHQSEGHRDKNEAQEQVSAAGYQLQLSVLRVGPLERLARHQVSEADGGERDEAEICAVQEAPLLPGREHCGADTDVASQDEEHEGHWYPGTIWCRRAAVHFWAPRRWRWGPPDERHA